MSQLNRAASEAMQQVGGHAATDITGFGLAGHALELALASDVAVHIELSRLPLLPGAVELARRGNKTRASATNRSFVEPHLECSQTADAELLELAFDAQTSGGLLISVPADGAEQLVHLAREGGAAAATAVGHVEARSGASLVLH
jgi:selenide,water dikinase